MTKGFSARIVYVELEECCKATTEYASWRFHVWVKKFWSHRKLVRYRILLCNQGLIQSLGSKERSVSTVVMTDVPKMFVGASPSFNFCFLAFFVQQYGSPPSKEETVEAGNSCPICQEELKDPIKLRACKVLYYWHQWLTVNSFATLLYPGLAIILLQWMRALCDISHGEKKIVVNPLLAPLDPCHLTSCPLTLPMRDFLLL